jgi:hypothetical protein
VALVPPDKKSGLATRQALSTVHSWGLRGLSRFSVDFCMRSWIRPALMWLLVVVVPVQGLAAGMMVSCGPNHARMAQMSDHLQHEVAEGKAHHHETSSAPADVGSVQPSHESLSDLPVGSESPLDKVAKFKCSACAACCTATAIPTSVYTFDACASTSLQASVSMSLAPVFLTEGPERPPRLLLA